jgi:hypothetical protein
VVVFPPAPHRVAEGDGSSCRDSLHPVAAADAAAEAAGMNDCHRDEMTVAVRQVQPLIARGAN